MTDPMRAADDIRYLPWEAKRARRPRGFGGRVKPLRREPPPPLTVLHLEPHHCRYPIADNPFVFCGADKAPGGHSYCVTHCNIAYSKGKYA